MPNEQINAAVEAMDEQDKKLKNYVLFILDRSGSMSSFGPEAIDSFNEQVKSTKEALLDKSNIEAEVSLVTFSSKVDHPELWCRPLSEVTTLSHDEYTPGGMTALYDAVGFSITKLKQQADIDEATVLVVIVTDGHENSSREYGAKQISELVAEVQATGRWTVVYEGANVDLAEVRENTNISANNMMSYDSSVAGKLGATRMRSASSKAYYKSVASGQSLSTQNFWAGDADPDAEPEDSGAGSSADK